jgi:hypothetical protein
VELIVTRQEAAEQLKLDFVELTVCPARGVANGFDQSLGFELRQTNVYRPRFQSSRLDAEKAPVGSHGAQGAGPARTRQDRGRHFAVAEKRLREEGRSRIGLERALRPVPLLRVAMVPGLPQIVGKE